VGEACGKTAWQVHALCLTPNPFHLVVETPQAKAERIVAEELKRRKWDEKALTRRRKGNPGKLAIAQRLRRETTVTLGWVAKRLQMGTRTHLAHLLYWQGRGRKK
jgi:hypothetical protein